MSLDQVLVLGYALVAVAAMVPTWLEQRAKRIAPFTDCLMGVICCLLWPLTATVVAVASREIRRPGSSSLSD